MTSFEKGRAFELYILNTFFSKEYYDLLHFTSNYSEIERFVQSDYLPDIQVKDRDTQNVFWIECKFRTKTDYQGNLEITSDYQLNRYYNINEKIIFVIGLGGSPKRPNNLYFVPIDYVYPMQHISELGRFKVIRPDFRPSSY